MVKLTTQPVQCEAVEKLLTQRLARLANTDKPPEAAMMTDARVMTGGDVPMFRNADVQTVSRISPAMVQELFFRAFQRDPTEFAFVLMGDLPVDDTLEPLLTSTIGALLPYAPHSSTRPLALSSICPAAVIMTPPHEGADVLSTDCGLAHLPSTGSVCADEGNDGNATAGSSGEGGSIEAGGEKTVRSGVQSRRDRSVMAEYWENMDALSHDAVPWLLDDARPFSPDPSIFPDGIQSRRLKLRTADKATVLLGWRNDLPAHDADAMLRESTLLHVACRVVRSRLLETLRIKQGAVYSVAADTGMSSLSHFTLPTVSLHCEPGMLEGVLATLYGELAALRDEGPTDTELRNVVEASSNTHLVNVDHSSYWLFWLLDSLKALLVQRRAETTSDAPAFPSDSAEFARTLDEHCAARSVRHRDVLTSFTKEDVRACITRSYRADRRVEVVLEPRVEPNESSELVDGEVMIGEGTVGEEGTPLCMIDGAAVVDVSQHAPVVTDN